MKLVVLVLMLQHTRIGGTEFGFIKAVAEFLCSLGNLLIYLFFVLAELIFYQHIGSITFLWVTIVNQRVIEGINVAACFPYRRVHEDGRIDTNDVVVEQHHWLPPILFDVVLKLYTVLTIVINRCKTIVYIATWKNKTIFFAMAYYLFKRILLCHNIFLLSLFVRNLVQSYGFLMKQGY